MPTKLKNLHLYASKNMAMKNNDKLQGNFKMNMFCMNFLA